MNISNQTFKKIWLDDVRTPPDHTWRWFKTAEELIEYLEHGNGWRMDKGEINIQSKPHIVINESITDELLIMRII